MIPIPLPENLSELHRQKALLDRVHADVEAMISVVLPSEDSKKVMDRVWLVLTSIRDQLELGARQRNQKAGR